MAKSYAITEETAKAIAGHGDQLRRMRHAPGPTGPAFAGSVVASIGLRGNGVSGGWHVGEVLRWDAESWTWAGTGATCWVFDVPPATTVEKIAGQLVGEYEGVPVYSCLPPESGFWAQVGNSGDDPSIGVCYSFQPKKPSDSVSSGLVNADWPPPGDSGAACYISASGEVAGQSSGVEFPFFWTLTRRGTGGKFRCEVNGVQTAALAFDASAAAITAALNAAVSPPNVFTFSVDAITTEEFRISTTGFAKLTVPPFTDANHAGGERPLVTAYSDFSDPLTPRASGAAINLSAGAKRTTPNSIVWMRLGNHSKPVVTVTRTAVGDGSSTHTAYTIRLQSVLAGKWTISVDGRPSALITHFAAASAVQTAASAVEACTVTRTGTTSDTTYTVTFSDFGAHDLSVGDAHLYGPRVYLFSLASDGTLPATPYVRRVWGAHLANQTKPHSFDANGDPVAGLGVWSPADATTLPTLIKKHVVRYLAEFDVEPVFITISVGGDSLQVCTGFTATKTYGVLAFNPGTGVFEIVR